MKGILGLLQYPVERMKGFFDDMCDNISLESAVKQLEADCSFAKRHPWEIDLVTLSEEQLRDLAQSNPITQKVQFLSELPSRLASFEKLAHDGDVRARQASNALRAHGKLMQMQNAFKSKFSQQVCGSAAEANLIIVHSHSMPFNLQLLTCCKQPAGWNPQQRQLHRHTVFWALMCYFTSLPSLRMHM